MTNTQFKSFKNIIAKTDANNDIWWMGFYFLDLTPTQIKKCIEILEPKFGCRYNEIMKRNEIVLPSGLAIIKK